MSPRAQYTSGPPREDDGSPKPYEPTAKGRAVLTAAVTAVKRNYERRDRRGQRDGVGVIKLQGGPELLLIAASRYDMWDDLRSGEPQVRLDGVRGIARTLMRHGLLKPDGGSERYVPTVEGFELVNERAPEWIDRIDHFGALMPQRSEVDDKRLALMRGVYRAVGDRLVTRWYYNDGGVDALHPVDFNDLAEMAGRLEAELTEVLA